MTTEAQPQIVRNFLDQLEAALVGVPGDISGEIVAGVTEELAGLDAVTAAARIEEFGDPAFIAAEARAGTTQVVPVASRTGDPRWYTVLTALLVAVGGIVIPLLGWIVGIAMLWLSKTWRTWEKWVATLTPLVATVLAALVVAVADGLFAPPAPEAAVNPLLPPLANLAMASMLFLALVVVGVWLLRRVLRSDSGRVTNREL